jgi:hypothetical protein
MVVALNSVPGAGITHPKCGAAVLQPGLFPGERWGHRHNRPQGLALTARGAAPHTQNYLLDTASTEEGRQLAALSGGRFYHHDV